MSASRLLQLGLEFIEGAGTIFLVFLKPDQLSLEVIKSLLTLGQLNLDGGYLSGLILFFSFILVELLLSLLKLGFKVLNLFGNRFLS